MRGDGILCTHNGTGGTGALTLVAVTGWPNYDNVFTGTRLVEYEGNEYTDSTYTVLKQRETGIGSLVTGTLVLTRTKILATWDGTNYLPKFGTATAPTAISFGNTAANIRIVCSPSAEMSLVGSPWMNATITDNVGICPLGVSPISAVTSTVTLSAGFIQYYYIYLAVPTPISTATARIIGVTTGGSPTLSHAIYEVGSDGKPGKKLIDFGSLGVTTSAASISNSPIATPVMLTPGWYVGGWLYVAGGASGTPTCRGMVGLQGAPGGLAFAAGAEMASQFSTGGSQTSLADPATAFTTASNEAYMPQVGYK